MKGLRFLMSKTFWANLVLALVLLSVLYLGLKWTLNTITLHDETIEVPDLAGLQMEDARTVLEERKLEFEILDSSEFNNAYEGHAIWLQYPRAGAKVKRGRPIQLTINPIREPLIVLPELVERTKRRAIFDLHSKGFEVGELTYVPYIGKDVVVEVRHKGKEAKANSLFPKGSVFDLIVGGGLSDEKVMVPYLLRSTLEEAEERLLANSLNLGLVVWDISDDVELDSSNARVYKQQPQAGGEFGLRLGSDVDIWLTNDSTKWPVDTLVDMDMGLDSLIHFSPDSNKGL